jgi:hypothetical protein
MLGCLLRQSGSSAPSASDTPAHDGRPGGGMAEAGELEGRGAARGAVGGAASELALAIRGRGAGLGLAGAAAGGAVFLFPRPLRTTSASGGPNLVQSAGLVDGSRE